MDRFRLQLGRTILEDGTWLKRIHKEALQVIEKRRVEVRHRKVQALLSNYEGTRISNGRVYFKPWLVEDCISSQIEKGKQCSSVRWGVDQPFEIITGYPCLNLLDLDSGKYRTPNTQDLVQLTKLADALGMVGNAPVEPADLPHALRQLAMFKICWQNSRHIGGASMSSFETAEYIYEMAQVVGKKLTLPVYVVNPLRLNDECLEIIYRFLNRKVSLPLSVGTMPKTGLDAPFVFPAALVQTVAECIAGYTVLKLISGKNNVRFGATLIPIDMSNAGLAFGSPTYILFKVMEVQINKFYGMEGGVRICGTMAKEPDAQAAVERSMGILTCALAGASGFSCAGKSQSELFSPELLVIDREIVNYVTHLVKGIHFHENSSVEIIKRVVESNGSYLTDESTLDNFRDEMWNSRLFEYTTLMQWQHNKGLSIREKIRKIARNLISQHNFKLPREENRELEAIYQRAMKQLL